MAEMESFPSQERIGARENERERGTGQDRTGQDRTGYLGAIRDDKERLPVDHKGLDVVGFADFQDVDVLDLDEFVGGNVPLVNMGATKELRHNDEKVVADGQGLADHGGSAWNMSHKC